MSLQLRRKTHESIVYIDSDSAPRVMPSGEDFILEDLPVGTRVLYPNPPLKGLPNREAAIRYALNHPLGCDPLFAQLEPGMKVTVAVDDISLPLPPMATPDIRQSMLEIVLDIDVPVEVPPLLVIGEDRADGLGHDTLAHGREIRVLDQEGDDMAVGAPLHHGPDDVGVLGHVEVLHEHLRCDLDSGDMTFVHGGMLYRY